jgi:NADH:ubiquinone oxidoreductase subunit 6 (subunit J)
MEAEMMMQDLNLLAVVGLVACWGAVALVWLAGAIRYESQAPAERTRAWYASPMWITTLVMVAAAAAVPRADWRSLTFYRRQVPQLVPGLRLISARTLATFCESR